MSTGLFEETLRGYKVTVFRKRQEATLIEKSVKLSNELCVDYIKNSYILLFLHVLQEKKNHKTKVNSCFDSSEITANEGGVVNEFKKKMKNCNQRMINSLLFIVFLSQDSMVARR